MQGSERTGHIIYLKLYTSWTMKTEIQLTLIFQHSVLQWFTSRKKAVCIHMFQMRGNTCIFFCQKKKKPLGYKEKCILEKWTTKINVFWGNFDIFCMFLFLCGKRFHCDVWSLSAREELYILRLHEQVNNSYFHNVTVFYSVYSSESICWP